MHRFLKAVHMGWVLLMTLYCGKELLLLATKWLDPSNDNVRYWHPGWEMVPIGVAFVVLLGILGYSVELFRVRRMLIPLALHAVWLVCLSWFAWFYSDSPFQLHEIVGIDFDDAEAVSRFRLLHWVNSAAVYVGVAVLVGLPVILRWYKPKNDAHQLAS